MTTSLSIEIGNKSITARQAQFLGVIQVENKQPFLPFCAQIVIHTRLSHRPRLLHYTMCTVDRNFPLHVLILRLSNEHEE